jgi:two-component system, NarL family, response regulator LiaR
MPEQVSELTRQDTRTLRLLARGLSNKEIARHLDVSEKTVRNRLSGIYDKLNLTNRTQAALYAVREGIATGNPVLA